MRAHQVGREVRLAEVPVPSPGRSATRWPAGTSAGWPYGCHDRPVRAGPAFIVLLPEREVQTRAGSTRSSSATNTERPYST
jgi:hypothetical protein